MARMNDRPITGLMLGTIRCRNSCHRLAPSISAASSVSDGIDWMAPRNSTKFRPRYRHTDTPASEKFTKARSPSQSGVSWTPGTASRLSSTPPGFNTYRKMNEIATPLIRYGKKMIPLNRFLNRILKLSIVAR